MGMSIQKPRGDPLPRGIDHTFGISMSNGGSGDLGDTAIFDCEVTNSRRSSGAVEIAAAFDDDVVLSHDCVPSGSCYCRSARSEEHTSELQSRENLVCRLLLEKKKQPSKSQQS